jgi:tetraacyldisaccharide 4'-kinase
MNSSWINRAWEHHDFMGQALWLLLIPLSGIFSLLVNLRNLCFSLRWRRALALGRPAISIGNLTVGGTGKTPSCIWLARALEKHGLKVAILTRGYGGKRSAPVVLSDKGNGAGALASSEEIAAAGDEACMMAKIYGQTVAVCEKRHLAARELLDRGNIDVFILDDGFQHRRVKREADIVVLGSDAPGWILPAGPFRESPKALHRADFLLVTGAEEEWAIMTRSLRNKTSFKGSLCAVALVGYDASGWKEYPLNLLHRRKIAVVAGIAHPERFYRLLRDFESDIVDILEFADHYNYSAADWQRINRAGLTAELVVTTEKDIIKLARFPFAKGKLMALRVEMVVENGEALVAALSDRVREQPATGGSM